MVLERTCLHFQYKNEKSIEIKLKLCLPQGSVLALYYLMSKRKVLPKLEKFYGFANDLKLIAKGKTSDMLMKFKKCLKTLTTSISNLGLEINLAEKK